MRYRRMGLISVMAALACPAGASAAPYTTVQRTVQDCDGDNLLEFAAGEQHVGFPQAGASAGPQAPCVRPADAGHPLRLPPSASILNFLHLSDFQIVDEESPARVEFLDATQRMRGLQPFSAAYRPQESLTTQVTEAMVRQARNAVSPVTAAPLDLAILTGDNADSQQHNETRWFIDILDGTDTAANRDPEMDRRPDTPERKLDPDSGIPEPGCEGTPGSRYDGVRDGGRSGFAPDGGYYEPDSSTGERDDGDGYSPLRAENLAETPGRDVTVRDFPGLLERANEPFEAVGLDIPWYSAFGNHDALIQGNSPDAYFGPFGPGLLPLPDAPEFQNAGMHGVATGCVKVQQPAAEVLRTAIEPLMDEIVGVRAGGATPAEQADIDRLTGEALALTQAELLDPCDPGTEPGCSVDIVPPDDRRCFLAKDEADPTTAAPCSTGGWIEQHFRTTGQPVGHGFAPSPPACSVQPAGPECLQSTYGRPPQADYNDDGYYSFSPRPGLRFVVLDTVTDECGSQFCSEGSVDDPQFRWLAEQIRVAAAHGEYVLTFSHHTLRTIRFPTTDPTEQPAHYGQRVDRRSLANPQNPSPQKTLEELYCESPNVLAHVAGHEHENYVERHDCEDDYPPAVCVPCANPHFWQVSTAAHIDWPQQARMIELVDVGGEMSFVLTILDHDGPANPGGAPEQADQGQAPDDVVRLAAVAREIAYNDYQADRGARGGARHDRNVILPTGRRPPPYAP